ncbi:MAG TPA: murein biosynthesis integral membrane protein MurJ [Alphaproteobacteria bacterium]|jgi:putative peptidoglycan lipid II flippase
MALMRAITTVGGYTLVSRVLGFIRDMLLAAFLGAGPAADAFVVAFKLPNLFRRLFAEGAFSAAFVPMFARKLAGEGQEAARFFAEQAQAALLLSLIVFVVVAELTLPWTLVVIAPGFGSDPAKYALAVELTRITFPYLLFVSLVSLVGGVLNGLERFAATSATPVFLNLVMIAGLAGWQWYAPSAAHGAAWGVTAAGLAQMIWLYIVMRGAGFGLKLRWPRLTPEVRRLLILMMPVALGAGIYQINVVIDVAIASLLPSGSVSYLYYADRLVQLPLGVVGIAIGTALLPILARQIRSGDGEAAMHNQNRALEVALLLTLPAGVALTVLAHPIIEVLFQRGAFGGAEVTATAYALAAYSLGLPAQVLVKVFTPGYFAREDTAAPVRIAVFCMVGNALIGLGLMFALRDYGLGHLGIAFATTVTGWVNALMLSRGLAKRGHFHLDARARKRLLPMVAASFVMGGVLFGLDWLLSSWLSGAEGLRIGAMAILVLLGMAVYAVAAQAFGAMDLREMKALLRRPARPVVPPTEPAGGGDIT